MKIFKFLFLGLFLLSASRDIIRDLPYNIYQIEDMEQYETKYLPEGNKFYIRFPSNLNQDIKFYLTIPKNTTLFPNSHHSIEKCLRWHIETSLLHNYYSTIAASCRLYEKVMSGTQCLDVDG